LIWLMPTAFAVHIVEEYTGGFVGWVTHVIGGSMSGLAFALNNAAFMTIMLALTTWCGFTSSRLASFLLIFWVSANLFWDGLFHVIMTAVFDRYSPGLITASLFYIPLSLAVAGAALQSRALSISAFFRAITLGAGLMGFIIWYGLFHFAL
jgi:hypothetical protein